MRCCHGWLALRLRLPRPARRPLRVVAAPGLSINDPSGVYIGPYTPATIYDVSRSPPCIFKSSNPPPSESKLPPPPVYLSIFVPWRWIYLSFRPTACSPRPTHARTWPVCSSKVTTKWWRAFVFSFPRFFASSIARTPRPPALAPCGPRCVRRSLD